MKAFLACERGATAVEYGLIVAGIFLAIVGAVNLFASNANVMFTKLSTKVGAGLG